MHSVVGRMPTILVSLTASNVSSLVRCLAALKGSCTIHLGAHMHCTSSVYRFDLFFSIPPPGGTFTQLPPPCAPLAVVPCTPTPTCPRSRTKHDCSRSASSKTTSAELRARKRCPMMMPRLTKRFVGCLSGVAVCLLCWTNSFMLGVGCCSLRAVLDNQVYLLWRVGQGRLLHSALLNIFPVGLD